MAPHSSTLAWRIPGTGEPGGLPSMGSHRVGHDWSDLAATAVQPLEESTPLELEESGHWSEIYTLLGLHSSRQWLVGASGSWSSSPIRGDQIQRPLRSSHHHSVSAPVTSGTH